MYSNKDFYMTEKIIQNSMKYIRFQISFLNIQGRIFISRCRACSPHSRCHLPKCRYCYLQFFCISATNKLSCEKYQRNLLLQAQKTSYVVRSEKLGLNKFGLEHSYIGEQKNEMTDFHMSEQKTLICSFFPYENIHKVAAEASFATPGRR